MTQTEQKPKPTVDEIARFVAKGNAQSARNCRVLLNEIERLRRELARRNEEATQFKDSQ